jgi:hypothetical protein
MVEYLTKKKSGIILIVFAIMASACAPDASARAMYAEPCQTSTNEGIVYRQEPQSIVVTLYQNAFINPTALSYEENLTNQKYDAIQLLSTQTERWSDSIDILLESKLVRLTITYLSPELIHSIILNHYLFRNIGNFANADFKAHLINQMDGIAKRNEHIFFFTLTASQYETYTSDSAPVIVELPFQSMVLTNSSGIQVTPQHKDHQLESRIDITHGPEHGYFSYPIAVQINDHCESLLDKSYNAHFTLNITYIGINGTNYDVSPWVLDYAPLLDLAQNPNIKENMLQIGRTPEHFRPNENPPFSIMPVDAEYWETLARFIWHETTLDPQ